MMKRQSRTLSLIESLANVAIGLVVALVAQHFVFPLFGVVITFKENLGIAGIMTVVSITRSYLLRRLFNSFWFWRLFRYRYLWWPSFNRDRFQP